MNSFKMQIIQHRVNTIAALHNTSTEYGAELDIRDKYDKLIIQHDAFLDGEDWNSYIKAYQHGLLVANIKTEGIEEKVMQDLVDNNINNFFLLDVSLPFLIKLANKGTRKMAVRFSEMEPIELATQFVGKVDWVWIDCFTHLPLTTDNYTFLKQHFKLCIVSPELHGHSLDRIKEFRNQLSSMPVDAVCTKKPELWMEN
jgi:hypothetical protein